MGAASSLHISLIEYLGIKMQNGHTLMCVRGGAGHLRVRVRRQVSTLACACTAVRRHSRAFACGARRLSVKPARDVMTFVHPGVRVSAGLGVCGRVRVCAFGGFRVYLCAPGLHVCLRTRVARVVSARVVVLGGHRLVSRGYTGETENREKDKR